MAILHYLAYGSNLHPHRLAERAPSASLIGTVSLRGYRLAFHKCGADGSGKCDLVSTAIDTDMAHAALFRMDSAHRPVLDEAEGPGYARREIEVVCNGIRYTCFTYFARDAYIDPARRPYRWYRDLVALGAEYLAFPGPYVERIRQQAFIVDSDAARQCRHDRLIAEIRRFR